MRPKAGNLTSIKRLSAQYNVVSQKLGSNLLPTYRVNQSQAKAERVVFLAVTFSDNKYLGGTKAVLLGSAISGIAGYIFSIIGARVLGPTDYANIGILWTLQFLIISISLLNIEAWITRNKGFSRWIWGWFFGIATLTLTITSIWRDELFHSDNVLWPFIAVSIAFSYCALFVVRGIANSKRQFLIFGALNALESTVRLICAMVLVGVNANPLWWALIMPIGPLVTVALWRLSGHKFLRKKAAVPTVFLFNTTSSNAISQMFLAGSPVIVSLLGADEVTTSIVFATTTLGRAPLVFLHGGLLARVLPPLLDLAQSESRARISAGISKVFVATLGLCAAAFVGGGLIGPPLVSLTYGQTMTPSFTLAGSTGVLVIASMSALLLGQTLIALDSERVMILSWLLGVLVFVLCLIFLPLHLLELVVLSSALGVLAANTGLSLSIIFTEKPSRQFSFSRLKR